MEHIWLAIAVGAETIATAFLKKTEGFTVLGWSILCAAFYVLCYYSFAKCIQKMNLGIAYAIWCGVGILASTTVSVLIYRQKISTWGIFGILLILAGCVIIDVKG